MTITTGTEKQIAWATTIKAERLATWTTFMNRILEDDPRRPIVAAIIELAEQITDAATWIDNRNTNPHDFLRRQGIDYKALAAQGFDARRANNVLRVLPNFIHS